MPTQSYKSMLTVFLSERWRRFDLCGAASCGISPKLDTLITFESREMSSPPPPVIVAAGSMTMTTVEY